jgi:hypothetical protein
MRSRITRTAARWSRAITPYFATKLERPTPFDEAQIAELQCVFGARWQLGLVSSQRTAAGTQKIRA